VGGYGGIQGANSLPAGWKLERFTVVPVGNGKVAFHGCHHNRFIRMKDNSVDAKGGNKDVDQLPLEWKSEQWEVVLHPLPTVPGIPCNAANHTEAGAVVAVSSSALTAGAVPLATIGIVQAAGFSSGGIIAGSTAAGMMAAEAVAAGGGVAAGGTVATLQSVGAVGFASGAAVGGIVLASAGGAALLGYGIYLGVESFTRSPTLSHAPRVQSFNYRKVAIKAPNGKFLIALGGGRGNWFFDMMAGPCHTGVVKADAKIANLWEFFTVHPCEQDYFALQSHHGAVLCAGEDGVSASWDATANEGHVHEMAKFRFSGTEDCTDGVVRGQFQAWDGTYLTINHKHKHWTANARHAHDAATFEVHVIE
jgi:hypothetical protein